MDTKEKNVKIKEYYPMDSEKKKFPEEEIDKAVDLKFWKKRRNVIAVLAFFGFFISYLLRVNLSIAIVAMTTSSSGKKAEFEWDSKLQGFILSSFFYGFVSTQLLGGCLSAQIGGKRVFGMGLGVTALLTFMTPPLTRMSVYLLISLRVVEGIFEGVTYPAIHSMWANWIPPAERSQLSSFAVSGTTFGAVFSMSTCGIMAERLGWPSVFYISGALGLIWFTLWCYIVADKPEYDPHISKSELNYIKKSLGHSDLQKLEKISHPWKSIFKSTAVWAIFSACLSEAWGFYTLLTQLPKFMNDVLSMQLENTGLLSAVPYLILSIVALFFGHVADYLRSKKILSTTNVRKLFTCSAFLSQIVFMVLAGFSSTSTSAIICLSAAVGLGGIAWSGFGVNPLDIAPQHASIIIGIGNTIGALPGIFSPVVTGCIVTNGTASEWRIVFMISGAVYFIGIIVYGIFGSGEQQKWALEKNNNDLKVYSNQALDIPC